MDASRKDRVRAIFATVRELPAEQRAGYVRDACGSDEPLRVEVESLLQHDEAAATRFMKQPAPEAILKPAKQRPSIERVGQYAIKETLAAGGFGTVYHAIQDQPRRSVAVKVMNHGITAPARRRRFEYEAQMLARLTHPNIAQIYEAGTYDTDAGQMPFFAMEYVPNAKSIIAYVRDCGLSVRDRLKLFVTVCDAVDHGHQKGIIHRDLKPQNILVDAWGRPKIIDFGIARATDSDLAAASLQTSLGDVIGTPEYMSPEQCEGDPHILDTRSDVYALGVVLYELLCDRLPYAIADKTMPERLRIIREEPPTRPSSVKRRLHGDIETITLKALEKNPARRYRSAAALGDDLHRFLSNEPIEARPPSVMYQLRMLARRRRGLVIAVMAGVLAFGVGIATESVRRTASSYQREFMNLLLVANKELQRLDDEGSADVRLAIARGALDYIEATRVDDAETPTVLEDLAQFYTDYGDAAGGPRGPNLGRPEVARSFYEKARDAWHALSQADPTSSTAQIGLVTAETKIADIWLHSDPNEALKHCNTACDLAKRLHEDRPDGLDVGRAYATALLRRGDVHEKLSERAAMRKDLDAAREILERLAAEHPADARVRRDLATAWVRVAYEYKLDERCDEARPIYVRYYETMDRAFDDRADRRTRRDLMWATYYMWDFEFACGEADDAARLLPRLVDLAGTLLQGDSTDARARGDVRLIRDDLRTQLEEHPEPATPAASDALDALGKLLE